MNRTFCFVPVRKGSRGIPGKNLRLLGDKPLVCWIIDTVHCFRHSGRGMRSDQL